MKTKIILCLIIIAPSLLSGQIILKENISTQKNISLAVKDNYYVGATIQQNHWVIQPMLSLFTTRFKEEYWLMKGAYNIGLGKHVLLAPGVHFGGNLGPDFSYVYASVQAVFTFDRFYVNLEPMYGNVSNAPFKINASLEYEAMLDKIFLSAGYRPNRFLANEQQYWQFGLAMKENRMSIQPAFLIPDDFNVEKLQFILSVNYWIK